MDDFTQFGIQPEDEGPHAYDPAIEWWNESWFWDWYDDAGESAGHCRIGVHAHQQRAWIWFFLYRDGEWLAVEQPRLPLADLDLARLTYDRFGLRVAWDVETPLRSGRLRFEGFGRALCGRRQGMILPLAADLEIAAEGPPHSIGRSSAAGHSSERYPASRFEQPIAVRGSLSVDDKRRPFAGRGERDHSWGPRFWNLEWTFLVLGRDGLRVQGAEAVVPGAGRFVVGYLQRERMVPLGEARLDFEIRSDDVLHPIAGRFAVRTEEGEEVAGTVASLTAAEIDLTHAFVPPQRSLYRRALVRARLDDGGPPLLGWVEFNRLRERA